jgi:hypothetical protein
MKIDDNILARIFKTIAVIVDKLVKKEYAGLESLSKGIRLHAEHIEAGVSEYGGTVTHPPEDAYSDVDVIQISGKAPPMYSIRFRLYTEEEGQSDLEVQATFLDEPGAETMPFELDNILVP